MQIPISEVRAKLPQLIKQLQQDPSVIYEITVHQAVVAELKSPPQLKPALRLVAYDDSVQHHAEDVFRRLGHDKKLSWCDTVSFVVVTTLLDNMVCLSFDRDVKQPSGGADRGQDALSSGRDPWAGGVQDGGRPRSLARGGGCAGSAPASLPHEALDQRCLSMALGLEEDGKALCAPWVLSLSLFCV
jgi:hypothetical protein